MESDTRNNLLCKGCELFNSIPNELKSESNLTKLNGRFLLDKISYFSILSTKLSPFCNIQIY